MHKSFSIASMAELPIRAYQDKEIKSRELTEQNRFNEK